MMVLFRDAPIPRPVLDIGTDTGVEYPNPTRKIRYHDADTSCKCMYMAILSNLCFTAVNLVTVALI